MDAFVENQQDWRSRISPIYWGFHPIVEPSCGPFFAKRAGIMDLGNLVERVRGEFIEMPGLQLTEAQAARLWGVEPTACRRVVEVLVGAEFLRWTSNGRIARAERA